MVAVKNKKASSSRKQHQQEMKQFNRCSMLAVLTYCCVHRGTGAPVSRVSRASLAPKGKMALWGHWEILDPKDLMELQDLQDKMALQDLKVGHCKSSGRVLVFQTQIATESAGENSF